MGAGVGVCGSRGKWEGDRAGVGWERESGRVLGGDGESWGEAAGMWVERGGGRG